MKSAQLRIIFMGTPDFAVAGLAELVDHGCQVVAVITAADKPKGRGKKVMESPVKTYAVEKGIPVLQPTNLKNPEFLEELKGYRADLQIVVAFRMLPEVVWNMPKMGTFNLHASLLPQYRGAAPINWAIINGETRTGITTFFLQHEIDTGAILFQESTPILPEDNAGTLHDKLMVQGAKLIYKTVEAIAEDHIEPVPQSDSNEPLKSAPKIFKEDCEIKWAQSAAKVNNFIRGLSPYPAAWTKINDNAVKVYSGTVVPSPEALQSAPGTMSTDNKSYLHFQCQDGQIAISALQMPGKKRMDIKEFFRGNKL